MNNEVTYTDEQAKAKLLNPISGKELAEIIATHIYIGLGEHQAFEAGRAYPKARVKFGIEIELFPQAEGQRVAFQQVYDLDLTEPPDMIRVLEGLPTFQKAKQRLAEAEVVVEKAVVATEEATKGAEKAARAKFETKSGTKG